MQWSRLKPISPIYAYVPAAAIALICLYGWTYEYFPYGDLDYTGPLGRLSGWLSKPVTRGVLFWPPQRENVLTTLLLIWLFWFSCLRMAIAAWNFLTHKWNKWRVVNPRLNV